MSMQPRTYTEIPVETQRVAKAAFPKGNVYMRMRDELGELYGDEQFAELFPSCGQPAASPGRLAWVTIMQFGEGLSDRQAADAVRGRLDWKYVLGLELTDPGFDYSVLSEFRARLLAGQKAQVLLDTLLAVVQQRGLLKARGRQRTDSTHILAAMRSLNRLELVGETMRQALNELAGVMPEWLQHVAPTVWFQRYGQHFDNLRLPKTREAREQLSETIGADGFALLTAVYAATTPAQRRQLPGVEILRQLWLQQYWVAEQADGTYHLRLRTDDNQPAGEQRIHSPYDVEARYSAKQTTAWVGYKAYLTESCDEEAVHLITHVETTSAAIQDVQMTETIHTALAEKALLPSEHLMDAGFIDAEGLVSSEQAWAVEVCGPVKKDVRWQAQAGQGFGLAAFTIDWAAHTVTCPEGQQATAWAEQRNAYDQPIIQVKFKPSSCQACPSRTLCTQAKRGARSLVLHPQAQHEALQQRRKAQQTAAFWHTYAKRSGIEGTISQAVRRCDLRRSRYVGCAKTHLQLMATATALNFHRLFDWLTQVPRALTRTSPFARLAPDPALVTSSWRF